MCQTNLVTGIKKQTKVNLTLWLWHNKMCLQIERGSLNYVPRCNVNRERVGFKILMSNRR